MYDIKMFKLSSGEVIISFVEDETQDAFILRDPRIVVPRPVGPNTAQVVLVTYIVGAAKNAKITLAKDHILSVVNEQDIDPGLRSDYSADVTGIAKPSSTQVQTVLQEQGMRHVK